MSKHWGNVFLRLIKENSNGKENWCLHEIGDLGLGFEEVPKEQEQALKEQMQEKEEKKD